MIKVHFLDEDGSYNAVFSEDYRIDKVNGVYSLRRQRYLKQDDKKRVWLSVGRTKKRFRLDKLWKDSQAATYGGKVKKFTNTDTVSFTLDHKYFWRKPSDAAYDFDVHRVYEPTMLKRIPVESVEQRFMRLLMKSSDTEITRYPTFMDFARWSVKYSDQLKTLQDGYDLYRNVVMLLVDDTRLKVTHRNDESLYFNDEGSITVIYNDGLLRVRPQLDDTPSKYTSSLLANNRLTFGETNGLISGSFIPLLTWVFRGRPKHGWKLFNLTGNNKEFDVNNWTWIDPIKEVTYTQMRQWLIQRWCYEVVG